jgi:hypothetical protein
VAAGVRVLGAEGRPEGVDLGQRQAVGLDIELPRHRQERLAAKEILREIDLALGGARQVGEIQGRHPEQCPGPLRVAGGDDRRIDPERPLLVELDVPVFTSAGGMRNRERSPLRPGRSAIRDPS